MQDITTLIPALFIITAATKFPTFGYRKEDEIEPIFQQQLQKLGVDFIDYYLIHNVQTVLYDGIDGKGGIAVRTHLFALRSLRNEYLGSGKGQYCYHECFEAV